MNKRNNKRGSGRHTKKRDQATLSLVHKGIIITLVIGLFIGITHTRIADMTPDMQQELLQNIIDAKIPNLKDDDVDYLLKLQDDQEEPLTVEQIKNEIEWRRAEVITPELP